MIYINVFKRNVCKEFVSLIPNKTLSVQVNKDFRILLLANWEIYSSYLNRNNPSYLASMQPLNLLYTQCEDTERVETKQNFPQRQHLPQEMTEKKITCIVIILSTEC